MVTRSKSAPLGRPYTRSETAFNADIREVLRMTAGFSALHVREADLPGVFDLLVTEKRAAGASLPRPPAHLWLELKIGKEEVRPSQVTFMRARMALGELLYVGRLFADRTMRLSGFSDTQDKETELVWMSNFQTHPWDETLTYLLSLHYNL